MNNFDLYIYIYKKKYIFIKYFIIKYKNGYILK